MTMSDPTRAEEKESVRRVHRPRVELSVVEEQGDDLATETIPNAVIGSMTKRMVEALDAGPCGA
jgi:hypothetical protein